jgi:hypothetical protein
VRTKHIVTLIALLALATPGVFAHQRDAGGGRLHSQLTGRQRDQYNVCSQSVARLHTELGRLAGGDSGFYLRQLHRQRQGLVGQMRALEQANHRLVQSLNRQQRAAVGEHEREMQLIQEHSHVRLRAIDRELAKPNPSQPHVAQLARVMAQQIDRWGKQNRALGEQLGLAGALGKEK